jgi:hypothetical protein
LPQYEIDGGTAAASGPLPATDGGTLDDADVPALLMGAFDAGSLPPPTTQTVYVLYPPDGLTVTQGAYTGCVDFQGYHSSAPLSSGPPLVYAMVPRCSAAAQQSGLSDLDFTTWGASHEIAEASTDPLWQQPAWVDYQANTGEIGDLCDGYPVRVDGNLVTALYSNAAAAADERACLPAPTGPNFGVFATPATLSIPAGDAGVFAATVYAAAPLSLILSTYADLQTIATRPDSLPVNNGDTIPLTVTVPTDTPSGQHYVELYLMSQDQTYHAQSFLEIDVP